MASIGTETIFRNLAEFQDGPFGTDPTDYYNGNFPDIVHVSGGEERGDPGTFSTQPLVLKLTRGGLPLGLSPITLSTGDFANGQLSVTNDGTGLSTLHHLTTASNGLVSVYYKHPAALPDEPLKRRVITAQVGSAVREGAAFRRTYHEITLYDYTYPANTVGRSAARPSTAGSPRCWRFRQTRNSPNGSSPRRITIQIRRPYRNTFGIPPHGATTT